MNPTNTTGKISELIVAARMIRIGWEVCEPIGTQRYDLLINRGEGWEKVQVKTGKYNPDRGVILYNTKSNAEGVGKPVKYDDDYCFAVYCPTTEGVYFLPPQAAAGLLRVDPPKNGQIKYVLWAEDFRL